MDICKDSYAHYDRKWDVVYYCGAKTKKRAELILLHELIHSTGANHRLNRPFEYRDLYFETDIYDTEEVIAECAAYLFYTRNIGTLPETERAFTHYYIQHYMEELTYTPYQEINEAVLYCEKLYNDN